MNPYKQFWTLLKFQLLINPAIFFMLIAFTTPLVFSYMGHISDHLSLDLQLSNQNLFFVGIFGVFCFAPEIMQTAAASGAWTNGSEFLLTRAIDRVILFRARAAFFYLLILAIPLMTLLANLSKPSVKVEEFDKVAHARILREVPGATAAPADQDGASRVIAIPNGKIMINSWHVWTFILAAFSTQLVILVIQPMRYRRPIFWAFFIAVIFLPLLNIVIRTHGHDFIPWNERCFFFFASHQLLLWAGLILAWMSGELWCERRFSRLEA